MYLVIYGPEGSGKGTQAKLLSEKLNLPILTSGDIVRDKAANDNTKIGDICRNALKEGRYVADSVMFVLWKDKLKKSKKKGIYTRWISADERAG
jgi:adenylate kinase